MATLEPVKYDVGVTETSGERPVPREPIGDYTHAEYEEWVEYQKWLDSQRDLRIGERAQALRRMAKGRGVSHKPLPEGVPPALFDCREPGDVETVVAVALAGMPRSNLAAGAIRNALSLFRLGTTLDQRRDAFAAEHAISKRTVMRLEAEGAKELAEAVEQRFFDRDPADEARFYIEHAVHRSPREHSERRTEVLSRVMTDLEGLRWPRTGAN